MTTIGNEQITALFLNWSKGDKNALETLGPIVYQELRRMARSYMKRERPGHTLQSTALVHKAYMRLIDQRVA
jgi:RNA polymerase sigma-70 factor (ECF subfamily)